MDDRGNKVPDFTNGCIEDPRIFMVEDEYYLSAACRMFPAGPFWIKDDPMQCAPVWASRYDHGLGRAACENVTVTVLYKLDVQKLKEKKYDQAFQYIGPITDPERGENRDVFLFPEKLDINGREQYLAVHRPKESHLFPGGSGGLKPSIWLSAAEDLHDLGTDKAEHKLLAKPLFDWELNRIGGSWPFINIEENVWL